MARENGPNLVVGGLRLSSRRRFLMGRAVWHQDRFLREMVQSVPFGVFKTKPWQS